MNIRRFPFRTLLCALAGMAAAAIASATTLTYSGLIDIVANDGSQAGDSWRLTVVLPDPLVDTSGGGNAGDLLYTPSAVSFVINGVTRVADFNFGAQFEGVFGYQGRYGNGVTGFAYDGFAGISTLALGLGSASVITGPDGLLLPGVVLADLEDNHLWFQDYATFAYIGGHVTSYTVETGPVSVPDTAPTLILLGATLPALACFSRRRSSAHRS